MHAALLVFRMLQALFLVNYITSQAISRYDRWCGTVSYSLPNFPPFLSRDVISPFTGLAIITLSFAHFAYVYKTRESLAPGDKFSLFWRVGVGTIFLILPALGPHGIGVLPIETFTRTKLTPGGDATF